MSYDEPVMTLPPWFSIFLQFISHLLTTSLLQRRIIFKVRLYKQYSKVKLYLLRVAHSALRLVSIGAVYVKK